MQCHSRWFTLENTGQKTEKDNTQTEQPRKGKQRKTQQNKTSLV